MQVFGVTGSGAEPVVDTLIDRLEGRVGIVRRNLSGPNLAEPQATTYTILDNGWRGSGSEASLPDVLDRLAPTHEYAIVESMPDARVPTVVVGSVEQVDETLVTVEDPAEIDPEAVIDAVDALEPFETLTSLVTRVKASPDAPFAGAIATFTGRVRAKDHPDDDPTEFLEFEKYDGIADERMSALETDLERRDGVYEVVLHHRTGIVEYGEDIVFVVVLAGHRREAFRTVEAGIDRLKDEVPLFKKEVTSAEEFWVHDRV